MGEDTGASRGAQEGIELRAIGRAVEQKNDVARLPGQIKQPGGRTIPVGERHMEQAGPLARKGVAGRGQSRKAPSRRVKNEDASGSGRIRRRGGHGVAFAERKGRLSSGEDQGYAALSGLESPRETRPSRRLFISPREWYRMN